MFSSICVLSLCSCQCAFVGNGDSRFMVADSLSALVGSSLETLGTAYLPLRGKTNWTAGFLCLFPLVGSSLETFGQLICRFAARQTELLDFFACSLWWAQVDSNNRPHAYQACALTNWAMSPHGGGKRDRTDDPLLARQVLSQLSYTPMTFFRRFKKLPNLTALIWYHIF